MDPVKSNPHWRLQAKRMVILLFRLPPFQPFFIPVKMSHFISLVSAKNLKITTRSSSSFLSTLTSSMRHIVFILLSKK